MGEDQGEGCNNKMEDKLVEIYKAQGEAEAQVIKTKLESLDIPAVIISNIPPSVYNFVIDGLGSYRVMVSESRADEARKALKGEDDV